MDLRSVFRVRPNSPRGRIIRRRVLLVLGALYAVMIPVHFPWATDDPVRREDELRAFYEMAYTEGGSEAIDRSGGQRGQAKHRANVVGYVHQFAARHQLQHAKVLDIGSGTGYLQDVVPDYTGIDISSAAKRHYHKPFVAGTATAMPFPDASFDAAWSIWVLEHIPNPEAALNEMRRVIKPGGVLLLWPAYGVEPWAAQGYAVRPYSDLALAGKLNKLSIPFRQAANWLTVPANRAIRALAPLFGPTTLHYDRLAPNYVEWWQSDSDAVNGLGAMEIAQWFTSRGDECLNCSRFLPLQLPVLLEIRIHTPRG